MMIVTMFTKFTSFNYRHFIFYWAHTGWTYFEPEEAGFKEQYELFKLATETLQQPAIVIDSDDLVNQPGILDI